MIDDVHEHVPGMLRLGDALRHRDNRPGFAPIAVSLLVHAAAFSMFFLAGMGLTHKKIEYRQVAIHLVSPPPTVKGPPQPIETTSAVVATPNVEIKKTQPAAKPKPQTQSTDSKVVSKPTNAKPAQGAHPKPGPIGGEGLNINQEGVAFAYPDYLGGVVKTLVRYLRWEGPANLTAEVVFTIRRDGSVTGVELTRSSGNMNFDLAAIDAVENAGRQKALGALPKGFQGDRLPIRYTFAPTEN